MITYIKILITFLYLIYFFLFCSSNYWTFNNIGLYNNISKQCV